jgi:hypothetical protein
MNLDSKSNGAANSAPYQGKRNSFGSILEQFEKKSSATHSVYVAESNAASQSAASHVTKPLKAK